LARGQFAFLAARERKRFANPGSTDTMNCPVVMSRSPSDEKRRS
jgi:hypothetical protein